MYSVMVAEVNDWQHAALMECSPSRLLSTSSLTARPFTLTGSLCTDLVSASEPSAISLAIPMSPPTRKHKTAKGPFVMLAFCLRHGQTTCT